MKVQTGNAVGNQATESNEENVVQVVKVMPNKETEKIVCDVCGYANPKYTALCEKCSNYLI